MVADVAEWEHVDTLTPWDRNPRDNKAAIPKVAASIRRYGFPTVVTVWDEHNLVLAGHTRVAAMRAILLSDPAFVLDGAPGPGYVPVRRCKFANEDEARLFALADNKLGEEARWDNPALSGILAELSTACGLDALATSGFDPDDVLAAIDFQSAAANAICAPPTHVRYPDTTTDPISPMGQSATPSGKPPTAGGGHNAHQATGGHSLPLASPTLVLVGVLLPGPERDALLRLAYQLSIVVAGVERPDSWEGMASSPMLGATILHALRVACGKVGGNHD